MGNTSCTLRSVRGAISLTLSGFHPESQGAETDSFGVSVASGAWQVEIRASSDMEPDLGGFFRELADHWKGWEGERGWSTLEGEFSLSATSDRLGHIRLAFSLSQPFTGLELRLTGALELEAGMLDSIAKEVSAVWGQNGA